VRAAGSTTLLAGKTAIHLWGVEEVEAMDAAFKLKARTALDNIVGGQKVECEMKSRDGDAAYAQCVNAGDNDLSLFMLQQGYVTADRAQVYGTVFEDAYVQAEIQAQERGLGVWAEPGAAAGGGSSDSAMMISFGFILFLCIIAAFAVLSIIIMRGFQKVIDAQNDNVEMMAKERKLRDKERAIVAVMLDSELKANKAKIDAYLVVYEEMLRALKDPDKPPRYKKAGDIVQKQPALDRAVFDRNTDKLDILGERLSSAIIHFYARIKSKPEYENLEPDMDLQDAIGLIEKALENARRMNKIAERLLEAFSRSGVVSEVMQD
jgi:hypothetical protein